MKRWFSMVILTAALVFTAVPAMAGKMLNDGLATRPFSHHVWQDVLNRFVSSDGAVNFTGVRLAPKRINQYLGQLASVSPESHPAYFQSKDDELAYWINAHNALVLRQLLNYYPAKSLRDLPEDFADDTRYPLGGKPFSLQMIMARIERFHRPEAFLALSDYTYATLPVSKSTYEGPKLDQQLRAQRDRVMAQVRYDKDSACVGIRLPLVLKRYEAAFLRSPDAGELPVESDTLDVPLESDYNARPQPKQWNEILFTEAPPEVRLNLRRNCPHKVTVQKADPAFRQ